jgi:hypothetical protein
MGCRILIIMLHYFLIPLGLSLCGAGAGGFAAVILKRDKTRADLFSILNSFQSNASAESRNALNSAEHSSLKNIGLTISAVTVDRKGISTKEFREDVVQGSVPNARRRKLADYLFM